MNTTKRQTCNVCKVSLTMDNFKLKRDSTYQKGCEECLKKRRALAKKHRDSKLKKETTAETSEQRAARIFKEDEEIQRKRSEKEAQTSLVTAYKKRTQALERAGGGKQRAHRAGGADTAVCLTDRGRALSCLTDRLRPDIVCSLSTRRSFN
jgi:hypothetical protein